MSTTQLLEPAADKLGMRDLLCVEKSPLYQLAHAAYRDVAHLACTDNRLLNSELRRHALRAFQHCTVGAGELSSRQRAHSRRFARMAFLKVFATIDAVECEEAASLEDIVRARQSVVRVIGELEGASLPAAPDSPPKAPAAVDDDDWERVFDDFPPFDPSRVVSESAFTEADLSDDPAPGRPPH